MGEEKKKRARWKCRLFGHRFYSPGGNGPIAFYVPSAEGAFRYPQPDDDLVGTCGCGKEWRKGES